MAYLEDPLPRRKKVTRRKTTRPKYSKRTGSGQRTAATEAAYKRGLRVGARKGAK